MEREGNVSKFTPATEDKDKSVSSQVLEYYQKYSLNRELPKYFSGTPAPFKSGNWSELPPKRTGNWFEASGSKLEAPKPCTSIAINTEEVEEQRIEPCITASPAIDQESLCELPPSSNVTNENACATSPASSVTSNRKLEWDNGADIGYSNVSTQKVLQKSISLPVLTDVEYEKLQESLLNFNPKGSSTQLKRIRSEHSSNSDLISNRPSCSCNRSAVLISFNPAYSTSTTESVRSLKRDYISTSSSSESIHQQKRFPSDSETCSETHESGSILNFLRGKFGLPIAESTPKIRIEQHSDPETFTYLETPKLTIPKKEENSPGALNTLVQGAKLSSSCEDLSSPKIENTAAKRWHSQVDLSMVDKISHYKNMKILKLCTSKPVVVECVGDYEPLSGKDKFIQTSLPRNSSIAVQTDFDFTGEQVRKSSPKSRERQSVLYVCHSDSDKDANTRSSSTQTNCGIVSNCNSFEFLHGADYDQNFQSVLTDQFDAAGPSSKKSEMAIVNQLVSNLRRCPPKSDLAARTSDNDKMISTSSNSRSTSKESSSAELHSSKRSDRLENKSPSTKVSTPNNSQEESPLVEVLLSKRVVPTLENKLQALGKSESYKTIPTSTTSPGTSKESPLTELSSSKQSDRVVPDLENKLRLLQKVIKSTKYDSDTKKYYLQKIIQKMLDEKNAKDKDDSLGSYPSSQILGSHKAPQGSSATSSKSSSDRLDKEAKLQDNKPWKPAQQTPKRQVVPKKFQTQTFVNEMLPTDLKLTGSNFVPIQVIRDGNDRLQRTPLFTLTDGTTFLPKDLSKIGDRASSNSTANELYEELPAASESATPGVSSILSSKRTISDEGRKGQRSWREDKTRSEQLFEQKGKDHLSTFAKKEREHQLYWINNEISHLNKLKKMLEQKRNSVDKEALSTIVQKPHVEDMKGLKKSTTVYVVTTEKRATAKFYTCNDPNCVVCSCSGSSRPRQSSNTSGRSVRMYQSSVPGPQTCCKCNEVVSSVNRYKCNCDGARDLQLQAHSNVVEIGNEKIDLKRARLVSNEQFTTGQNDQARRTSIRRYTFEIPIESPASIKCGPCCSGACSSDGHPAPRASPVKDGQHIKCGPCCNASCSSAARYSPPPARTNEQQIKCAPCCTAPCSLPPEQCRCSHKTNRLIQELVNTDEIVCPCCCKEQEATCPKPPEQSSQSSSSSSSSESDVSCATQLCSCCKRQLSSKCKQVTTDSNEKYILCHPCYNQSSVCPGPAPHYGYPGHVCNCHGAMQAQTVQRIQETLQELDDLEREEEMCKCASKKQTASGYCAQCKCKLKQPTKKGGMAYVLTLEPDDNVRKHRKHKRKESALPEIRIKIDSPRKNKRETHRTTEDDCNTEESAKENKRAHNKHRKRHKSKRPTLQEYLCANKPEFVTAADQRRQCLLDLAYMREKRCQKYKQLLALTSELPSQNSNAAGRKKQRIFDPKQMVETTTKNYKKLPEVQQKLMDHRDQQIKKANRLLADIFNRKLREQVLRGRHTLPPDASIINLAV